MRKQMYLELRAVVDAVVRFSWEEGKPLVTDLLFNNLIVQP